MSDLNDKKIVFPGKVNFNILPCLGFGSQGDVYKYKIKGKNYALKVFNGIEKLNFKLFNSMLDVNIDSYITPLKLLYVDDKFSGYLMNYCSGDNLEDKKLNIKVDSFKKSYTKLFNDTEKLSEFKYVISDLATVNSMYDKGIKIIDVDDYDYDPNKSIDEINHLNKISINRLLVNILKIERIFIVNKDMKELISKCNDEEIDFNEVFNKVYDMACNISDTEITHLIQIRKALNIPFYRR